MRRSKRALLHVPGSCAGVATTDTFGDFTGSRFRHAHDLKQIASNDEDEDEDELDELEEDDEVEELR